MSTSKQLLKSLTRDAIFFRMSFQQIWEHYRRLFLVCWLRGEILGHHNEDDPFQNDCALRNVSRNWRVWQMPRRRFLMKLKWFVTRKTNTICLRLRYFNRLLHSSKFKSSKKKLQSFISSCIIASGKYEKMTLESCFLALLYICFHPPGKYYFQNTKLKFCETICVVLITNNCWVGKKTPNWSN